MSVKTATHTTTITKVVEDLQPDRDMAIGGLAGSRRTGKEMVEKKSDIRYLTKKWMVEELNPPTLPGIS